jgi:DNA-directed RNA polymerase specialized sigma24 family protein
MASGTDIQALIMRAREGDEHAAAELVRDYEALVRRAVRMQLRDPRLRSVLDTADVCQSVMASFFARLALGQYELSQPRQLAGLLITMARSKVATRARRADVIRRDRQGQQVLPHVLNGLTDPAPDPSRVIAGRDLLEQFRFRLEADERALSDRRAEGQSWADIATELGGTPDALRKKLARALDRVACELGLDESEDL